MNTGQQDPTSLANLHDIVVPDPAPFWPPAAGWYLLGTLLVIALGWLIVQSVKRWFRNQYRRVAMNHLHRLRQSTLASNQPSTLVSAINQILKRTALAAWPREQVAALSGESWWNFLQRTGGMRSLTPEQKGTLENIAFSSTRSGELSSENLNQLFELAEHWIRTHRVGSMSG